MKKIIYGVAVVFISLTSFAQEADLFRKDGHKTKLKTISISPDNKYFISVENDTLAILWDIATGQQLRTFKNVEAARFKNNSTIYLAMNDKTFKEIDLDGQTTKTYASRGARYKFINRAVYERTPRMFYPEKGLYIFGDDVFDFEKGYIKRLPLPATGYNNGRDYSQVTNLMAEADKKSGTISFINIETGMLVSTVQTDNSKEEDMTLRFSPNGEKLLLAKRSAFLLIDVPAAKIQRTIKNSKEDGEFGAFSPDGEMLALVDKDYTKQIGQITMLDLKSGALLFKRTFKDLSSFANMQFAPDGKNIGLWFSGYMNSKETMVLLDARKGTGSWQYNWPEDFPPTSYGSNIVFSPDGQKIVFGNSKKLRLVGTSSGLAEKTFAEISQGAVSGLHFIDNNSRMVSSTREHIFIWNLQTGEMERSLFIKEKSAEDRVGKYAPSIDGKKIFVLREDNLIEIDSAGKTTFQFTGAKKLEYRNNVSVSYDGQYVMNQGTPLTGFCTSKEKAYTVEVFDAKTHKLVYTNNCVDGFVTFAKTQNMLLIKEWSNVELLKFYELPSGKLLYQIKVPKTTTEYQKPIFSQNDRYLTMSSSEKVAGNTVEILIDLKTKSVKTFQVTYAAAIDKRNDKDAMITPRGFAYGEKYIVYEGWRTDNVLFYDIELEKFDEQLTFNNPAGVTGFSAFNISPNGKFLLLGTYDGSMLLWDIEHKKLQGTMYPDASKKNWAVIAPQGQFDGNAGAQNDMFHVSGNTVVPLNSMFEKFWTPRLLPRILEGEQFGPSTVDVKKLKKAPTVKIQFKENTRNLEVDDDVVIQTIETKFGNAFIAITAECPLDAVTEIRLYQNGKMVATTRNLTVEDEKQGDKKLAKTFQVNLLEGTNRFRAIAFNTERTESRPIELNVLFKPERTGPAVNSVEGIQLHVLVIGINVYKNPKYNLNYAEADALAFKLAIENGSKGIFSKVNTYYIKDDKASRSGIVAELEKVKANAKPEDVFIFYYAGHGVVNDKKEFFLVPYDVTQLYGNDEALGQKGLSAASLQQFSKDIKAQKQLYILDACQSAGALDNIVASRGAAEEKAIAQLARSTGTHWLTASGSNQFASEFSKLGHGAFTYCLLEAFKGITDNGDKKITVKELDAFLQNKVPEITRQYQGAAQYPASYGYGNDFPVILLK